MIDDAADPDAAIGVFQQSSPSGGVQMPRANAALKAGDDQNAADAVVQAMQQSSASTVPPPPQDDSFLNRSWRSILDLPKTIARDLTPTMQMPGTAGPQPAPGFAATPVQAPITEPELFTGFKRGVRDVLDTGAEGLAWTANKIPGVNVDVDALRQGNKDSRNAWEQQYGDSDYANVGRTVGQIAATAPVVGGVGGLVTRGATALPGAVGRAVQLLTSSTPAATAVGRAGQLAAQGATTGATQAGLTSSASDQPVSDQLMTGATVGGVTGPVIGGLTKAVDVLRGFAGGVRPEVAALADQARQLGINVPLPALSSNPTLRIAADVGSKLPFSGAAAADLANQRAAQSVVAGTMGSTANTFGPAEMRATADRISQGYQDALAKVPNIPGGTPLATDLANIGTDATRYLDANTVGHVGRAIQEVGNTFARGPIDPVAYRSLTNSDGPLAKIADAAPAAAQPYLAQIRQAVKDRLIAAAPPGVGDDLTNLDAQWRAMKTIQPLAAKSTLGDIQLGGLQQQVINQSNRFDSSTGGKAYTGGGTLGLVGDIGKQFFGALPESGTAPRQQAFEFAKHPLATSAAAIPGLVNRPLQSWLRSPTVSGRIIDTSLGAPVPDIGRAMSYGLLGPIDYMRPPQ